MATMEICNGERVVVFLFVVRILFSVPVSLAAEATALCLLALAALLADVAAERSPDALRCFSARRGASSGILLGSVTMPAVLLSRLIQHSRSLSAVDFRRQAELSYMEMQYWTISVSSLCVLISVYFILRHSTTSDDHNFLSLATIHNHKLGMLYLLFYVGTCYSSLATECTMCLLPIKKISWFILHGLACIGLIHHLLHIFPYCASIGEALLVSSSLVLYFGDMLAYTLLKINSFLLSSEPGYFHSERSEISTILQGIVVGLLIFPLCYKFILKLEDRFTSFREPGSQASERSTHTPVGKSITFYAFMAIMLTIIAPLWMQFVKHFQIHPILWVFNFVFSEPSKRLLLCIYWIFIISVSVYRFYNISKHSKIERILLRKYYHLVAVLIFSPAVLFQPKFLDLAFGAAFAAFLVLEMIRIWRIWPLGLLVDQFMNAFTDHRDSDILIVSHFSLLLGCALPKWMSSTFNDRPLAAFAGILSLGIGDTMASVVGHKYGVLRWSKSGKKTIEGTVAGITSVMAACSILLPLLASTGYIYSQHWLSLLIAVTISGLLEAYTAQLDNAFIPLVFYSLLCL